ncbi:MAG: hypothetical protein WA019_04750, partial [Candidatus Moraniibacteriota bacterium]
MPKKWELREKKNIKFDEIILQKYDPIVLALLSDRGVFSQKEIEDFFSSDYANLSNVENVSG